MPDQRVTVLSSVGNRAFSSGADTTDLSELWRCIPAVGCKWAITNSADSP
jgi:hypothetical protein